MRITLRALCGALVVAPFANAITLDLQSPTSIKQAASTIAHGMMNYYSGNLTGQIPGLLPQPYYWWEAGAMFGSLIDYWYYTGDATYNENVMQAMLFQVGPYEDYMPPNQTKSLGNDDQSFWALSAMSAAEVKFPDTPAGNPGWVALAQAVFNSQAPRWDQDTCGGGLRWQIFTFNKGYNYKNSISNGCFFNLAARLGAYTQNHTYFEWAEKSFDWIRTIGLVSDTYQVFDGADDLLNCTKFDHIQWTYNAGVYLYGAAVMYNATNGTAQERWKTHLQGLVTGASAFFNNSIMFEAACEPLKNCNYDQQSFKAYLSRWMAGTVKIAPFTRDQLMPLLRASAVAAARSCSGGTDGVTCGTQWTVDGWDNTWGIGQQMTALEVIQSNLIDYVAGPVSNTTGGTAKGDSSAGTKEHPIFSPGKTVTIADRAGAGILTALVIIAFVGTAWWMVSED